MLEPGQIFASRYRILRLLAQGGMGAVFEAEHTATDRRVALKVLLPSVAGAAGSRERFQQEAKIAAHVESEHIVQVLDAGFDEPSGSLYLVMELLIGQTLAELIRSRGQLPADQVLALLTQVASGLDAAHGHRDATGAPQPIVHRDLKPENIFVVRRREGAPVAKILDFGIAKVLNESMHMSQEVRGTPLYMAFEQVTAGALSPQTDVWALGLIAHYALTGHHYWRSAETPAAGISSLFAEISALAIDPPSLRLRELGIPTELPASFDPWLLRCLEREPTRRFPSAGAAIAELARVFELTPHDTPARAAAWAELAATVTYAGGIVPRPPSALPPTTWVPGLSRGDVRTERSTRLRTLLATGAISILIAVGGVAWWRAVSSATNTPSTSSPNATHPSTAPERPALPAADAEAPTERMRDQGAAGAPPASAPAPPVTGPKPPRASEESSARSPSRGAAPALPAANAGAPREESHRHAVAGVSKHTDSSQRHAEPHSPSSPPFDPLNTGPSADDPPRPKTPPTSAPATRVPTTKRLFDPLNAEP